MEDNRKEKRDKYELWASLLEGQSVFSSENLSQADEELQKLSFLWNQCDPPRRIPEKSGRRPFGK